MYPFEDVMDDELGWLAGGDPALETPDRDRELYDALDLADTQLAATWMRLREVGRVDEAGSVSERRARIGRLLSWWGYWRDADREEAYDLLNRCPA